MNSLQVWLAIVGGLVLAAVVGHGAWQTRRAGGKTRAPRQAAEGGAPGGAVSTATSGASGLMPLGPQEPSFDQAHAPTEPSPLEYTRPEEPADALEQRLADVPAALPLKSGWPITTSAAWLFTQ